MNELSSDLKHSFINATNTITSASSQVGKLKIDMHKWALSTQNKWIPLTICKMTIKTIWLIWQTWSPMKSKNQMHCANPRLTNQKRFWLICKMRSPIGSRNRTSHSKPRLKHQIRCCHPKLITWVIQIIHSHHQTSLQICNATLLLKNQSPKPICISHSTLDIMNMITSNQLVSTPNLLSLFIINMSKKNNPCLFI